jgi:hypothetical protein
MTRLIMGRNLMELHDEDERKREEGEKEVVRESEI